MKKLYIYIVLTVQLCVCLFFVSAHAADVDLITQENIKGSTAYEDGIIDFKARKAMYSADGSMLELRDDVEFRTSDGVSLQTQAITWDQQTDLVSSKERVTINRAVPEVNIKGRGLEARTGLRTVTLEDEVEVVIPQEDSMYIVITCEGTLEVRYEEGLAVFNKDVRVSQKDSELYTDKAIVYFDSANKLLDRIEAQGNVRIVRGKDTSYANTAVYYAAEKRIVLEGRPRLVIFPESEGDELKTEWNI